MIHQTSKPYAFFKGYVKIIHRLFYRRVYISGLENIPVGDPIIFGPNHQNALMDPLAVLLTTPLQPVFLARADIFRSAINRPVLRFLKILPVYRVRDGIKSLGNNDSTFNESIGVLEANKQLALFPEARHHGQNFLLPLKKGIPRIALLAEEKNNFKLNLKIVPVGIHYSDYYGFNADLWVNFGKSIDVDGFREEFNSNPQKAHITLRDKIAEGIKPLILDIKDTEHYDEIVLLLNLHDDTQSIKNSRNYLTKAQAFVKHITKVKPEIKTELFNAAQDLHSKLKQAKLHAEDLSIANRINLAVMTELLIGLPLFLAGFLPTGLFRLPAWFLYRNLKDRQFESSYKFIFMLIGAPVSYALFAFLIMPFFLLSNTWISFAVFIALFPLGSYSLRYIRIFKQSWQNLANGGKRNALKKDIDTLKEMLKKHL
ncbi:1-acyl-sn-glycerol-3-phosphate acyltransferase [Saccharicrinis sp. FJH54]|uniref:1-acyl-sn-glycerol-3-phosphate acyltransferase n=1 Tax=Saccharicrinis sp. FJH54 TaxID=3344665 RepID=UPI0035D48E41